MSHTTNDIITSPTVSRLTRTLDRLRTEQTTLLSAHSSLLAYGIGSATEEVHDRLRAIRDDARTIAASLDALGATEQSAEALQGWAVISHTRRASAVTS
ncbi:hypothetical protein ACFPIJ_62700 [Dactylosporangium cerinum]|uniref:Uncharacterized protein n=1 Tax=Dactylosporangium cerinum TaxID=1434730 RepID=A0ABV9WLA2_9ACTN